MNKRPDRTGTVTWNETKQRWRLRLPADNQGRRREVLLSREEAPEREDAEKELDIIVEGMRAKGHNLSKPKAMTFGTLAESTLKERSRTGRNKKTEHSLFHNYLLKAPFVSHELTAITTQDLIQWFRAVAKQKTARGTEPSLSTLKHIKHLTNAVFKEALHEGHIASNPATDAVLPRLTKPARRLDDFEWLRAEEVKRILSSKKLPGFQRRVFTFALLTGARQGEIWGLRWEDVGERELTIRRHYDGPRKTSGEVASIARVFMVKPVRELLEEQKKVSGDYELVFPNKKGKMFSKGFAAGWFDVPWRPLDPETGKVDATAEVRHRPGWRTKLGIHKPVRFHDLRHTCAIHLLSGTYADWGLVRQPLRMQEVSSWLGHEQVSTTERYYARFDTDRLSHLIPDD